MAGKIYPRNPRHKPEKSGTGDNYPLYSAGDVTQTGAIEMTGKRLPAILVYDYFRNVVFPWLAFGAAASMIASATIFASIVIG